MGGALATLAAVDVYKHTVIPFNKFKHLESRRKLNRENASRGLRRFQRAVHITQFALRKSFKVKLKSDSAVVSSDGVVDEGPHEQTPLISDETPVPVVPRFQPVQVTMYNYGSPRVGNSSFAGGFLTALL